MDYEERGYFDDPYAVDFTATVKSVEPVEGGRAAVYLDKTLFYPESGGQPDDRGTLGGATILAVSEDERGVRHLIEGTLAVGAVIEGRIDRARRFDHMQQHSGQHLLSSVFVEERRAATVGFHLGEEECTIDLDVATLDDRDLAAVERRVNELVFRNVSITAAVRTREAYEASRDGGAAPIRSRLPGGAQRVRVVEIDGVDRSTCCGTHCRSTGEIGIVKILGTERVRRATRVKFICGARALGDYTAKHEILKGLAREFTTDWRELGNAVPRLAAENRRMFKEIEEYRTRLASYMKDDIAEPTGRIGRFTLVKRVISLPAGVGLKEIALGAAQRGGTVVLLGASGERPILAFACSPDVPISAGDLMKRCAPVMGGRGGGGKEFAQGGGGDPAKMQDALGEAERSVREIIER